MGLSNSLKVEGRAPMPEGIETVVHLMAMDFIPGHHVEGRAPMRRGLKQLTHS